MASLQILSTIAGGYMAKNSDEYEADQLKIKGQEEFAAASRAASEKRQEGALVNSRQQALAAISGGGAGSDAPTILKLMGDTAGQAEYNAMTELYGGESRRRGLLDAAKAKKLEGKASLLGAYGTAFGQAAQAAKSYG